MLLLVLVDLSEIQTSINSVIATDIGLAWELPFFYSTFLHTA